MEPAEEIKQRQTLKYLFCLDWSFSADGKKFVNMKFIEILQNLIDLAIYKVEWKITDISRKNNV